MNWTLVFEDFSILTIILESMRNNFFCDFQSDLYFIGSNYLFGRKNSMLEFITYLKWNKIAKIEEGFVSWFSDVKVNGSIYSQKSKWKCLGFF